MASDDPIERAHLRDAAGFSPPIERFAASPAVADLVRRFWVPIWSLPPGETSVQRVLQYPVCQLVVAPDYARLVGPRIGMSTRELAGTGWALGAMLQPAAGALLLGASMRTLADRDVDLADVAALDGAALAHDVRLLLGDDPTDVGAQRAAAGLVEDALSALLPVDEEGLLVNALVSWVEERPEVARVGELGDRFAMTERSLQRLCARRVGLSPKWLIQRRRLHEAAGRLADPDRPSLTELAATLGYADHAHFARDFRAVTGLTPGEYAAEPRPVSG
jgi:AraC-like DNA-binding protein